MADVHLLRAQIEQSEQREVDARAELQSVAVLEPQRTLHPGLYPPDLVSAYGEVKKSLASRSRGALEVRSRPPGAAVYVDAQPGGSAPLVVDSLVAGRHYVTVSVPRLGSRTRSIELAAGRSTRVEIFVSDPAQRAPARQALRELRRGSPSAERMRPVLDYLGAELLLLVDAQARVELAFVDAQRRVQLRHFRLPPEEGVEPILARVVQEIHEQEARSARPEDAPKVRVEDDAPSPLLWGGVGLAGLGALVAGGVGLALWLAPRETPAPEERVVIYLGGGSSP